MDSSHQPVKIVCRGGPKDGWAFDVVADYPNVEHFPEGVHLERATYVASGEIDPETGRAIYDYEPSDHQENEP